MNRIPAQVAKLGLATLLVLSFAVAPGMPAASTALAAGCPAGPVTIGKLVRLFESGPGGRDLLRRSPADLPHVRPTAV